MEDKDKEEHNNFRSTLAQTLAALSLCVLPFNVGFIFSFITVVIGALRTGDPSMTISESQASWVGSLVFITQPIGVLSSTIAQDFLGRKGCLLVCYIPQMGSWILAFLSSNVIHLYSTVVLFGLSLGFMECPVLAYIGEASQPRLRGVLSTCTSVFSTVGSIVGILLGAVLSWRTIALLSMIGLVVEFVILLLLPESPAWLVSKGRIREAERAYQWLRGWTTREAVLQEVEDMVAYVKDTQRTKHLHSGDYKPVATTETGTTSRISKFQFMLEPGVLKGFRIVFIYFVVMASASLIGIRPFFIEILTKLSLPIDPHYTVVICAVVQFLGTVTMCLSLKPLGKRGLTFLSLGLSVFCCLGLGLYLASDLAFPLALIGLFNLSYYGTALGIGSVPWFLITELFPLRARGIASGICGAFAYVALFLVTKTYYSLEAWLDVSGTCLLNGVVGVLGFVYLYLDMPETEGVTLEEIERRLIGRRSRRADVV